MREYLKKLPREIQDLIHLASETVAKHNMSAYLVGGCVRDLILGVKNLDLDIVVEGNGISFAEDFAKFLKAKIIRHRRFGTATLVVSESKLKVDIATARKEFYPEPAHLPEVTGGTLQDDLKRRDFTINAMAISINKDNFGRLVDFFNGKKALNDKKIRILHNLSFVDDPTRILRAIRFEKRYNFRIEFKTLKCLKEAVKLKMLEKVQPQRLRDELILMLQEAHSLKQIKRIQELVGFGFINPHLSISGKGYRLLNSIEEQITWFKRKYPRHRQLDTWLIYFMGLFDSLDISGVKSTCRRFVFKRGEEKRILTCKKIVHKLIRELSRDGIRPSEIFDLLEPLSYEVILLAKAKSKNRNIQRHIENFLKIYNGTHIYISGDDLRKLGIAPGPDYQKIFKKVLHAKLNGKIKARQEEVVLIKKLVRPRLMEQMK
jgi:tRNA nucleotidyltransferase (CCA-adding enzyme)